MLYVGGMDTLSVSLLQPLPSEPPLKPPQMELLDTTVTANDRVTAADNAKMSRTTPSVSHQSTAGHSSASEQPPLSTLETETSRVVGPMIYVYFSTANTSDAGFTVDLLFQHPSYTKASRLICLIVISSSLCILYSLK